MKAYKVTVNGNVYEITLEVIDKDEIKSHVAAPTQTEKNDTPSTASSCDATPITAPMPGTILKVNVSNGQKVKKGDILLILEAMKMENEIIASADGTVVSVNVNSGASVETGAVLCTIA